MIFEHASPLERNPFHEGEMRMQRLRNMHEHVMSYAPQFIRNNMPDQHREFYEDQPFLVAAALDSEDTTREGNMWATMIFPSTRKSRRGNNQPPRVASSPHSKALQLDARVAPGDALEGHFQLNRRIGLLGIELETKRRNRVNGHISRSSTVPHGEDDANGGKDGRFNVTFAVDQSFGNCPQYITPRQWYWRQQQKESEAEAAPSPSAVPNPRRSTKLSPAHVRTVQGADTIFIATGYQGNNTGGGGNDDNDERLGNDASHRGGPPGFLRVLAEDDDSSTILLPDYSGNNHYNSIGNLLLDSRMGMMIPDFASGSYLQLSGTARVVTDRSEVDALYPAKPGTNRVGAVLVFTVKHVNDMPAGSIPLRWSDPKDLTQLQVTSVVQESQDVKSFVLEPLRRGGTGQDPLRSYRAGQYLPIHLDRSGSGAAGPPLVRTYSLSRASGPSSSPSAYRISVKRHPHGSASRHLHDTIRLGDVISAEDPAGEFVVSDARPTAPIVLLSVGIGVTPVLAILGELVASSKSSSRTERPKRQVWWVHGARNGAEHSFRQEVELLQQLSRRESSSVDVLKHVVYSQPRDKTDRLGENYDSSGRVNLPLVRSLLSSSSPPLELSEAEYYLCGPPGFVADLEAGLLKDGVAPEQVRSESF
jgi:uncharacterized protein